MKLVIIESPFAGNEESNIAYARACVRDSLLRNEAPIASHLLYTQPGILNDHTPEERRHGIDAGHAWLRVAQLVAVYIDHGISPGMEEGMHRAKLANVEIEIRRLFAEMTPGGDRKNVRWHTYDRSGQSNCAKCVKLCGKSRWADGP
jgi:hypothetical protein